MLMYNKLYKEDIMGIIQLDLPWYKIKGKNILITGANGMIGSVLIDAIMLRNNLFDDDISIYAIGRNESSAKNRFMLYWINKNFKFIKHDVNTEIPDLGNVDIIIHAASNTHPIAYASDPIGTITTNILGTYNLLNYASKHSTNRFIFMSSVEVYGENRGDTEKFDESYCGYIDCNTLRAGYPESKRAGEALCNAFSQSYGIEFVVPRLARIYGPSMKLNDSKAISQFILNAIHGENIVLKSHGMQNYSYCYITDAVSAILTILLMGKSGEAYNVSDDKSNIMLGELAEIIAKIVGKKVIYELPNETESKGFSKATKAILDNSKLKALGWTAKYDIKTGLERTVNILHDEV